MPTRSSLNLEAALEEFLRRVPIGVAILDADLHYVWTNPALVTMSDPSFGGDPGARFGHALPELGARLEPLVKSVMTSDEPVERVVYGGPEPEAGGGRSWRARYIPLHDDSGEVAGLGALIVEVTREATLARAQLALDRIGAELSTLDKPEAVAGAVPELLVREFVDTAVLYSCEEDGSYRLLSVRGDPSWATVVERDYAVLPAELAPMVDKVVGSGQPRVFSTSDVGASLGPRYREVSEAGERVALTTVVLPLVHAGQALGLLFAGSRATDFFDEDNVGTMTEISRIVAATLYFARLTKTASSEKRRAELLQEFGFRSARAETPDEVSDAVLSLGADLLGAGVVGVGLLGPASDELVERWRDLRGGDEHEARFPVSRRGSLLTGAFARGAALVAREASEIAGSFPGCGTDMIRTGYALPLTIGDRTIGAIGFGFMDEQSPTRAQETAASLVADQCSAALERIALDEARIGAIAQFQRSLLPETLPNNEWLQLSAMFRPSPSLVDIAGDWYDAFEREDGSICLIVADVAGKGMRAATTVGPVRHVVRLAAHQYDDPAEAIDAAEHAYLLGSGSAVPDFATVCMVVLHPGGTARVCLAGHLPPLCVGPHGATLVTGRRTPPLGVRAPGRTSFVTHLEALDSLVLYTDGLVERRRETLDLSLERLVRTARRLPATARTTANLPRELLEAMAPADDDIAILAATRTI